jgi:outer membrane protein assembly factor BamB
MAAGAGVIFVGLKGSVVAIDRTSGATVWESHLKGSDFVNVTVDHGELYAATRGRLYRLDTTTGAVLWENELPGYGLGIVSIAGAPSAAAAAEKKRRDDAAAAGGG